MKLKLFIIALGSLLFVYSCGNVKERKKEIPAGTTENVTTYTDPIEELGEEEFNNYSADSLENTTNSTGSLTPENEYSLLNDSTDEKENAISEELAEVTANEVNTNKVTTTVAKATSTSTTTTATTTKSVSAAEYKRFLIVGGSFKNLAKAQALDKQFRKEGVKSYISGPVNGYHRVIVGKYDVKAPALKDLTKFRKTYKKMRFWLLGEK
jgi:cell division septation protein DedD